MNLFTEASTSFSKLYLHANNIHQGGGRTLLLSLLTFFNKSNYNYFATLDARLNVANDAFQLNRVKLVKRSLLDRRQAKNQNHIVAAPA